MARYIHCEKCNKEMANTAKKYGELYESIEGIAIKYMFCDGGCGGAEAKEIAIGDKCFAAVLLPDNTHPNYNYHKPEAWAHEFIKPVLNTPLTNERQ